MKFKLHRPSPAMAVAGVALMSSFAAPAIADDVAKIAKTITGSDIKNGTVTGADLRNKTVRAADIGNGAVTGDQIKTNSVPGADILDESLTGSDVKDGSITGTEVHESTLDIVPAASRAGKADVADRAFKADDAETLDGKSAESFVASGKLVTGRAELKIGDEPKTVAEFNGYRVSADCLQGDTSPVARMIITNVSAGTSQIQTWWTDQQYPQSTDNAFDNGDSMLLIREEGNNWSTFKWEQYGPLNLFNGGNSTYMWGGASAAGINIGDHDCVAVFRSLLG